MPPKRSPAAKKKASESKKTKPEETECSSLTQQLHPEGNSSSHNNNKNNQSGSTQKLPSSNPEQHHGNTSKANNKSINNSTQEQQKEQEEQEPHKDAAQEKEEAPLSTSVKNQDGNTQMTQNPVSRSLTQKPESNDNITIIKKGYIPSVSASLSRYVSHSMQGVLQEYKQKIKSSSSANNEDGNQEDETAELFSNKIFNLETVQRAAQTKRILGLNSQSITPYLCSVGFHLVGAGPLFNNTTTNDNKSNGFYSSLLENYQDSKNGNATAIASSSVSSGKRRGRVHDDGDDAMKDGSVINDVEPSVPLDFENEIISFPGCNHTVCKSCALHDLTLRLFALREELKNNSTLPSPLSSSSISLECSFCARKGTSNKSQIIFKMSNSDLLQTTNIQEFAKNFFLLDEEVREEISHLSWSILLSSALDECNKNFTQAVNQYEFSLSQKQSLLNHQHQQDFSSSSSFGSSHQQQSCGICEEAQGSKFCHDCGFALCVDCLKTVHSKGRFKTHDVVDGIPTAENTGRRQLLVTGNEKSKNNYTKSSSARSSTTSTSSSLHHSHQRQSSSLLPTSSKSSTTMCLEHPQYPVEIFCKDCNKTACLMCHFAGTHKNHNVSPLTEVQENAKKDIVDACVQLKSSGGGGAGGMSESVDWFAQFFDVRKSSVDKHANDLLETCDSIFGRMHQMIDERKEQLVEKVRNWQSAAVTVAADDFDVIHHAMLYIRNILASCTEFDSTMNNNDNNNNSIFFETISSDKNSVTADTIALRDAVQHQVRGLLKTPLLKTLLTRRNELQDEDENNDEEDCPLVTDDDDDDKKHLRHASRLSNPSFNVIFEELQQALHDFLRMQTDSKLALPEWESLLSLALQKSVGSSTSPKMDENKNNNNVSMNNTDERNDEKVTSTSFDVVSMAIEEEEDHHHHRNNDESNHNSNSMNNNRLNHHHHPAQHQQQQHSSNKNKIHHSNDKTSTSFSSASPSTTGRDKNNNTNNNSGHRHKEATTLDLSNHHQEDEEQFAFQQQQQQQQQNQNNNNNNSARNSFGNSNNNNAIPQQPPNNNNNNNNHTSSSSTMMMSLAPGGHVPAAGSPGQQQHRSTNNVNNVVNHNQQDPYLLNQQQQQMPNHQSSGASNTLMQNNNNNNNNNSIMLPAGYQSPTLQQLRQGLALPSGLTRMTVQQRLQQQQMQMQHQQHQQPQNNNNNNQQQQQQQSKFQLHLGGK